MKAALGKRADLRVQVRTLVVVLAIFLLVILFALVVAANQQPGPAQPPQFEENRGTIA